MILSTLRRWIGVRLVGGVSGGTNARGNRNANNETSEISRFRRKKRHSVHSRVEVRNLTWIALMMQMSAKHQRRRNREAHERSPCRSSPWELRKSKNVVLDAACSLPSSSPSSSGNTKAPNEDICPSSPTERALSCCKTNTSFDCRCRRR